MPAGKQANNKKPASRKVHIRDAENRLSAQQEKIVKEAIRLFRMQGYASTSLSQIARNVDLDQSSIYYWFRSKEAVLESILSPQIYTDSLAAIAKLDTSWTIKLYCLIVNDLIIKCDLPLDFIELENLAAAHPAMSEEFIESYRHQYSTLIEFLEEGAKAGEFTPDTPVEERAVYILSINEGLQHYYHTNVRGRLILGAAGYEIRNISPFDIGHLGAKVVLSAISNGPIDIDAIRAEAERLYEMNNLPMRKYDD